MGCTLTRSACWYRQRDVGYAGLKDRHAVTRQWFSVRRPSGEGTDWDDLNMDGVQILEPTAINASLNVASTQGIVFELPAGGQIRRR